MKIIILHYRNPVLTVEKVVYVREIQFVRNYRDNCEKRCCSGSHKQFKTLFKDYMVRLKIISLYIYKDLRP